MQVELRDYQRAAIGEIRNAWQSGARNVCLQMATGAGKTVTFSEIMRAEQSPSVAIAHRQEIVTQIALALARNGVRHRIIGPRSVVKSAVQIQTLDLGRALYDPGAPVAVAGVDTLIARRDDTELQRWAQTVTLQVHDEAHHVLRGNKWGAAAGMFPTARALGVTATPVRADGKGLGAHADGIFETLVTGPGMRALIDATHLTDYRIFAPPSDLDLSDVTITSTGDYSKPKLTLAVRRSKIVGDVVAHYLRIAPGCLGVTFATDVETAANIAEQFNVAGVPAAVVTAKTPDAERAAILRRFANRELLQLVNVDLFGEGFDVPAIEVVSMARPTQSYGLYCQQFGRALRPMLGKTHAIIIDHVGNVIRHGLPDAPRVWTLDAREKRASTGPTDAIPLRSCPQCTGVYERLYAACPYCGFKPCPAARTAPEFVDGDLTELTAETLAAMRADIDRASIDPEALRLQLAAKGAPPIGQAAHVKRQAFRLVALNNLRDTIALWAGVQRAAGRPDSESYRRFYHRYGVDVYTAQTLNTTDATALVDMIRGDL